MLGSTATKQINMLKTRPDLPFPYKTKTPFKFLILSAGCLKYVHNMSFKTHETTNMKNKAFCSVQQHAAGRSQIFHPVKQITSDALHNH